VIERIDIFVYTLSNRRPPYSNRYDMRLFVRSTDVYKAKQHWPKSCIVNARLILSYTLLAVVQATKPQWRREEAWKTVIKDDDVHGPVWWISAVVDMAIDLVTLHHSHLLYFSLITTRFASEVPQTPANKYMYKEGLSSSVTNDWWACYQLRYQPPTFCYCYTHSWKSAVCHVMLLGRPTSYVPQISATELFLPDL